MAAVVALLSEDNEDGADCKATLDVVVVDIRHDGTDCRSVLVVVVRTADEDEGEGEGDRKVRTSAEGEAAPRDAAVCSCLWWQSPRWAAAALLRSCCLATGHSKMVVVVVEMERVIAAAGDGVMAFAVGRANVVVVHLPENEVVVVGMAVDDRTAACEGEVGSVLGEVVAGGACGAVVVLRCSRAAAAELRLDANKADSLLLLLRSPELRLDREDGDILVVVVVGSSAAAAGVQAVVLLKAFRPDKAQVALVQVVAAAVCMKTW